MEYAIFYDNRSKGAALKQLDGIINPSTIIRTFTSKTYLDAIKQSREINEEILSQKRIPILIVDTLEEPVYTSIYNNLHEFQRLVSGTIEIVNSDDLPEYDIICNGEGKLNQLPLNRSLSSNNEVYDVIAGPMVITRRTSKGETIGLSIEDLDKVHNYYYLPEIFSFTNDGDKISVVKPALSIAKIMKQNFISNVSINT